MGYYFSSYDAASIAIPDSARVSAALTLEALVDELTSESRYWELDLTSAFNDPIARVLDFIQFENHHAQAAVLITPDGESTGVVMEGSFDTKYNSSLDVCMRWLSRNGVGFVVNCLGEDGRMWRYSSTTGRGDYACTDLTPMSVRHAQMMGTIREFVQTNPDSAEARGLAAILGTNYDYLFALQEQKAEALGIIKTPEAGRIAGIVS